ncbi:MAG: permease-like cell division protein FtsX [Eubacteriales bacterium]
MFSRILKNTFKQGFQGILRNRTMSLASIGSVASVLIILGMILLLILNINTLTLTAQEKFDEIYVYLEDDIGDQRIEEIGNDIKEMEGVLSVVYQSKDYALNKMKEDWGEDGDLLDGFTKNPLPNTYVIQLEDITYSEEVLVSIENIYGIEEIKYYKDAIDMLINTSNYVQIIGTALIIILLLISIFIIQNTIKITVASRRTEIRLMQYIGASNGYVRGPFILEGLLLGLLGSIIATIVVLNAYDYLVGYGNQKLAPLLSFHFIPATSISTDILIIFVTIGIGIGILGSIVSLKKFLNV